MIVQGGMGRPYSDLGGGGGTDVRLEISTTTRYTNCKKTKFVTHIQTQFSVLPSNQSTFGQL